MEVALLFAYVPRSVGERARTYASSPLSTIAHRLTTKETRASATSMPEVLGLRTSTHITDPGHSRDGGIVFLEVSANSLRLVTRKKNCIFA